MWLVSLLVDVVLLVIHLLDAIRDYLGLANSLALFFQIRDDYQNLASEDYSNAKGFAEDLTEGKFSYLLIHAIRAKPDDSRLVNILKQKTKDVALKRHAIEYMHSVGSFVHTLARLRQLSADIHAQIDVLGGNALLTKVVEALTEGLPVAADAPAAAP